MMMNTTVYMPRIVPAVVDVVSEIVVPVVPAVEVSVGVVVVVVWDGRTVIITESEALFPAQS
ncbi:MAG: hypothetical protein ACTSV8_08380 [Candidatus Thorarchaeota archaeon]